MKKIYLSALVLAAGLTNINAQIQQQPLRFDNLTNNLNPVKPNPHDVTKAVGVTIYTNNFDNPTDWTIDNDGQAGGAFGWSIDATSNGWWSTSGINSTSGGNYAELSNGNAQQGTQALGVTYTLTLANPINIPALPLNTGMSDQVTLQFEQYGALFNDEQTVQISVDGGMNWIIVRDNRDYYSVLSQSGGSAYPNQDFLFLH